MALVHFKEFPLANVMTEDTAFNEGRETGLGWAENYTPGGPWVCREQALGFNESWTEVCRASKVAHDAWMRGFKEGHEQGRKNA